MTLDPDQAFRLLGLAPDASLDDVKVAYRDLAQVWHPDRFQGNERLREKALENLKRINEAYAVLRDYRPARLPLAAATATAPAQAPPYAPAPPRTSPVSNHRPYPTSPRRDLQHSLFTGMAAMRQSLKVLWPSATYLRRRRRRLLPIAWIVIGLVALALAVLAVFGLWYEGFLSF